MPDVISNTTCLIILDNIGHLDLLRKIYSEVIVSSEVASEYGGTLPDWIHVQKVKNRNYTRILNTFIDLGEASTIALGLEIDSSLLILDDNKARKAADKMGLLYTGTLGILVKCKQKGFLHIVKDVIVQMRQSGFYVSPAVEAEILSLAGEVNN